MLFIAPSFLRVGENNQVPGSCVIMAGVRYTWLKPQRVNSTCAPRPVRLGFCPVDFTPGCLVQNLIMCSEKQGVRVPTQLGWTLLRPRKELVKRVLSNLQTLCHTVLLLHSTPLTRDPE